MKKILSVAFIAIVAITGRAQSNGIVTMTSSYGNTSDTLTNTTANYLYAPVTRKYRTISVQPFVTKISGTSTFTVTLQGSLDNTNFVNITNTGDTLTATATSSTVTPTCNLMTLFEPNYPYIRIKGVGTGTMAAKFKGLLMAQPIPGNSSATENFLSTYNSTSDTVTNTATNYVATTVTNAYTTITIQPIVTKISGTAAGTVTVQGSLDNVNFVSIPTAYLLGASNTLTVTNVTTSTALFVITKGAPYKYYRLSYTGSGTMSCSLKGLLSAR